LVIIFEPFTALHVPQQSWIALVEHPGLTVLVSSWNVQVFVTIKPNYNDEGRVLAGW
jgi:hypothetical protein